MSAGENSKIPRSESTIVNDSQKSFYGHFNAIKKKLWRKFLII